MKTPQELDVEIKAIAEQIKTAEGDRHLIRDLEKQKRNLEVERDLKKIMVFGRL